MSDWNKPNRVRLRRPATTGQVALSTSAAQVRPENLHRASIALKNLDAAINIFIGQASDVATTDGYRLGPGQEFVDTESTGAWYAVAASGTPSIAFVEV